MMKRRIVPMLLIGAGLALAVGVVSAASPRTATPAHPALVGEDNGGGDPGGAQQITTPVLLTTTVKVEHSKDLFPALPDTVYLTLTSTQQITTAGPNGYSVARDRAQIVVALSAADLAEINR
jgi:hypothetical protein